VLLGFLASPVALIVPARSPKQFRCGWVRRIHLSLANFVTFSAIPTSTWRAGHSMIAYTAAPHRGREGLLFPGCRAHQHAMARLRSRRARDPAVCAPAGRRRRLVDLGSPRSGLINTMLAWAGARLANRYLLHDGLILVFGMVYAPYVYRSRLGVAQNGSEPGGGGGDRRHRPGPHASPSSFPLIAPQHLRMCCPYS